jgi:NhaA family Na+:H+ antiporter
MPDVKPRPRPRLRPRSALRHFLDSEAAGGVVLMGAATLALAVANSPVAAAYFGILEIHVGGMTLLHWINDGLMAVFFLLVGLEIKRELVDGQLSTWPRRILPGIAAAGGMAVPAVIYIGLNVDLSGALRGWAIPAATDIAFALGVLRLLGPRVPVSLKIFLTALAIIDDLGAVAIIAAFYTEQLALGWLALALGTLAMLALLNRAGVKALAPYILLGIVLWYFVLNSGVHATLAGIGLALTIPLQRSPGCPDHPFSPLHRLEHAIQPWVAFAIVPIFGFANAGVSLAGTSWTALLHPVTAGVAAGLFFGKQIGVFATTWLAVKLDWADCPENASWAQVYGVSLLAGIGFTMSLFIGLLAFPESQGLQSAVKLGVLTGSVASALAGAVVLRFAPFQQTREVLAHQR